MDKKITIHLNSKEKIYHFVALPLLSGLYGFAIFFITLIIAKWLGYLVGSIPQFRIDTTDAEMSILGFFFLFLIRFLKNFTPDKDNRT